MTTSEIKSACESLRSIAKFIAKKGGLNGASAAAFLEHLASGLEKHFGIN